MLVSVQLCRPSGRAGLAPAPAFSRSSWVSNPSPAAGPSRPFTFTGSEGRERRARQTMGRKSPLPQPRPRRVSSSARGNVCSNKKRAQGRLQPPFPGARAGGGARPRGRISSRSAGKGSGKDEQEPGLHRHLSGCSGSVGERICWSKRLMVRAQVACFAYVVVGREDAPLRHC